MSELVGPLIPLFWTSWWRHPLGFNLSSSWVLPYSHLVEAYVIIHSSEIHNLVHNYLLAMCILMGSISSQNRLPHMWKHSAVVGCWDLNRRLSCSAVWRGYPDSRPRRPTTYSLLTLDNETLSLERDFHALSILSHRRPHLLEGTFVRSCSLFGNFSLKHQTSSKSHIYLYIHYLACRLRIAGGHKSKNIDNRKASASIYFAWPPSLHRMRGVPWQRPPQETLLIPLEQSTPLGERPHPLDRDTPRRNMGPGNHDRK